MKKMTLSIATVAMLSFSTMVSAQSVYELDEMSRSEASQYLSDQEVIVKFSDVTVHDGLYTNPRFERVKEQSESMLLQQYGHLVPTEQERNYSLATLEQIEQTTGLKMKAVNTVRDYVLLQVSESDLKGEELVEYLYNTGFFQSVALNEKFNLQQVSPFETDDYKTMSLNPNKSNDPLYQNQSVFYEQNRSLNGAASVERARDLLERNFSVSGKQLNIAVIDSGATPHEDINWVDGYNFIADEPNGLDRQEVTNQNDEVEYYVTGHGLAVAGVFGALNDNNTGVKGILPVYADGTGAEINIIPAVAVNDYFGSTFDIYRAILWSVQADDLLNDPNIPTNEYKADVINMSIGGFAQCGNYEYSSFLQEAVDVAVNNNAVIVAAAGNEAYMANNNSPASCNNVITVGALDVYGEPTTFTNYGEGIDVMALGKTVYSPIKDGDTYKEEDHTNYGGVNGTSFSAPVVAGLAGMLKLIDRNLSPSEIESIIERTATPLVTTRSNFMHSCNQIGCGYGAVNFERAINQFVNPITNAQTEAESYLTKLSDNVSLSDKPLYDSLLDMDSCDAYILRTTVNNDRADLSYTVYGSNSPDLNTENGTIYDARVGSDMLIDSSAYKYFIAEITHTNGTKVVKDLTFAEETLPEFCSQQ
tara:strand:+ start:27040 stop:28977 length:1938 start_codon:yes stop_codon:yes gene_type:complete